MRAATTADVLPRAQTELDRRKPHRLQTRIVGSRSSPHRFEGICEDGIDATSVEGREPPYAVPNLGVELHSPKMACGAVVAFGRLDSHCVLTETSWTSSPAIGKDPYRSAARCSRSPRGTRPCSKWRDRGRLEHAAVSARVGDRAGAASPCTSRSTRWSRRWRSHGQARRLLARRPSHCAVDCGVAVNPDVIRAQMESGIAFASPRRCTERSR